MKKIIAAALSILVGTFGYTIVDSAIENRVSKLESDYASLQNVVSSLCDVHHETTALEESTTSIDISVPHTYPSLESPVDLQANFEHPIKFYLRLYSDGYVSVMSPGDSLTPVNPTGSTEITYEDHWLYITDSSAKLVAGEDVTRLYMDKNYSTTSVYDSTNASIMVSVTGYTNPVFAGKKLQICGSLVNCSGSIEDSGIINSDGTFSFTQRIDSWSNYYKLDDMKSLEYRITSVRVIK